MKIPTLDLIIKTTNFLEIVKLSFKAVMPNTQQQTGACQTLLLLLYQHIKLVITRYVLVVELVYFGDSA